MAGDRKGSKLIDLISMRSGAVASCTLTDSDSRPQIHCNSLELSRVKHEALSPRHSVPIGGSGHGTDGGDLRAFTFHPKPV